MSEKIRLIALTEALLGGVTRIRKMMLGIAILAIAAVPAMAACPAVPADCQAVDDPAIFELETNANAVSNGGTDWANDGTKKFQHDATNATIFNGGGSKDILGINQWQTGDGSVPPKDDIADAFATAKIVSGQLLVYFGADRTANNGDANMGFWFFQNSITPGTGVNAGKFNGNHADGDIFVVSGFTSGGQTADISVYKWSCSGLVGLACDQGGFLTAPLFTGTAVTCVSTVTGGAHTVCASSNSTTQTAPWTFCPKSGPCGTFQVAEFFEGGVNLGSLGIPTTTCFSSFIVETRSSTSTSAVLKDLVLDGFESCGVSLTKVCANGRLTNGGTQFAYDVYGTVTNSGSGTLQNVTVTDNMPQGTTTPSVNVGTMLGGVTRNWPGSAAYDPGDSTTFFTIVTDTNGPTNAASVVADAGGGQQVTGDTTASCDQVQTNPSMTVTKACTTDLAASGSVLAVKVSFGGTVCNHGDVPLNNVTVTENQTGKIYSIGTLGAAVGGVDTCASYGGTADDSYLPGSGTAVTQGRYSFQDTVDAVGTPTVGLCGPGSQINCTQSATATCYLCGVDQCRVP